MPSVKQKTSIASRISESSPVPGARLLTVPTKVKDAVFLAGSFPGGNIHAPKENQLVSSIAAEMLDEGTKKRNRRVFREAFESVGASIDFSSDNFRTRFTARCLRQHVPHILSLVSEALREPRFGATELSYAKARSVASIEQDKENTRARAEIKLTQLLYPRAHPNHRFGHEEAVRLVRRIERRDLTSFQRRAYGLGSVTIVAGGDVDHTGLAAEIERVFGDWRQVSLPPVPSFECARPASAREETVIIPDKANADVFIGGPTGISEREPAYIPLSFGMYVLGGTFFGRLYQSVREKQGLTYGVKGTLVGGGDGLDGHWSVWGTFAPDLLEKGKKALREEIVRWTEGGITDEELTTFKETMRGAYTVGFGTAGGFTSIVLGNAEQGRQVSWLDEYLARVQALTLREVNEAIAAHVNPAQAVMVAAGAIDTEH